MKTLTLGPGLWFNADFDDNGIITSMEEHDWRSGGGVRIPEGRNPNVYFLEQVYYRTKCPKSREAARVFIETCGKSGE